MKEYIDKEKLVKFIADGLNNPNKEEAFGHDAVEILSYIECVLEPLCIGIDLAKS